ncbi:MAG: hypothetical protein KY468_17060 [Armatimonadetes bacterium]|nr:hypothetical protein [Armatimonadota bacterium]
MAHSRYADRPRLLIRRPSIPALILLSLSILAAPARSQEDRFVFNPPDGTTFVVSGKDTRTQDIPRQGKVTETFQYKTRVAIRRVPEGFAVTETVLSATTSRNGKPYKNPAVLGFVNVPLTYVAGPNGQLLALRGVDALYGKVIAAFPPKERATMKTQLTREMLQSHIRADWDSRFGQFAGRSAKPGDTWTVEGDFTLPTGELVPGSATVRIADTKVPCKSGSCVRAMVTRTADPEATRLILEDAVMKSMDLSSMPGVKIQLLDLQGSETEERVIDPSTLLAYSQKSSGSVQSNLDLAGEITVPMLILQNTVEGYDYSAKAKAPPAKIRPKAAPKRKPGRR